MCGSDVDVISKSWSVSAMTIRPDGKVIIRLMIRFRTTYSHVDEYGLQYAYVDVSIVLGSKEVQKKSSNAFVAKLKISIEGCQQAEK